MAGLPGWLAVVMAVIGPAGLVTGWWTHRRASRKQSDTVALALVKEQGERIKTLEARIDAEQKACAAALDVERQARGQLSLCVEMLLTGYELPPAKRGEHIKRVRALLLALERAYPVQAPPPAMAVQLAEIDRRTAGAAE